MTFLLSDLLTDASDGVADGSPWWADGPLACERCGEEATEHLDCVDEDLCDACAWRVEFNRGTAR